MSTSPTYKVKFRRRREFKTDYRKRLALLKSDKPRLVVRKTNNMTIVEVVSYKPAGDIVNAFFSSASLKKKGWKGHTGNLPAAYLAGYACAKMALAAGVKQAVLDIGLTSPVHGSRPFAALKGAIDAGMEIPCDATVFPAAERLNGKHINGEMAKGVDEMKKVLVKGEQ
ncbi:MAG TPA: 50S ribosomal protein L18 [Candidatus Diapherotrites archaeon]|uniref:Large ribosomal subunit protein uL18 n=1 Tax=Candidatus Iainarchaeum sp. TaxID=3101447 RepID=A0A7J4J159_9ARCH|nr:50S ribosomal protein L18P [uncultured archaeon]HIH10209.1 50S ribosomal protein L18 [Candidatus Diapherotrites archaeon]